MRHLSAAALFISALALSPAYASHPTSDPQAEPGSAEADDDKCECKDPDQKDCKDHDHAAGEDDGHEHDCDKDKD